MIRELAGIVHADHMIERPRNGPPVRKKLEEPHAVFCAFLSVRIGFDEVTVKIESPELMVLTEPEHTDPKQDERLARVKSTIAEAIEQAFGVVKDMRDKRA